MTIAVTTERKYAEQHILKLKLKPLIPKTTCEPLHMYKNLIILKHTTHTSTRNDLTHSLNEKANADMYLALGP